jgi:hypothetical protein
VTVAAWSARMALGISRATYFRRKVCETKSVPSYTPPLHSLIAPF